MSSQFGLAGSIPSTGGGGSSIYTYPLSNSVRCDTNNGYLHRTPSSAGNRATWTFSTWIKLAQMGTGTRHIYCPGSSGDQDGLYRLFYNANKLVVSSANANFVTPSDTFRDPSAWYHILWKQGSNATTLYVNGEQIATASVSGNTAVNNNTIQCIGTNSYGGSPTDGDHLDGYYAETIMIDGTALNPDSFISTVNGVIIPKEYDTSDGAYGTNGFRLTYGNASDLGEDSAGSNDWTAVNLATHDQTTDSPTQNFCTINSVYRGEQTSDNYYGLLTEGNLKHSYISTSDAYCACTHKIPASGKWYWEYYINAGGGSSGSSPAMGIIDPNVYTYADRGSDGSDGSIVYDNSGNRVYKNTSVTTNYGGSRGSNSDVMMVAVDMDNGAFYMGKNGTWYDSGDPTSGASRTNAGATWTPATEYMNGCVPLSCPTGGSAPIITVNFGQEASFSGEITAGTESDSNSRGAFKYAVPSEYLAVTSLNFTLPSEIDSNTTNDDYPQKLFGATIWTGDGSTSRAITGVGFQPDWLWFKSRSSAFSHRLYDTSRGIASTGGKRLFSNTNGAEVNQTSGQDISAVGADGFTLGASSNLYTNDTNDGGLHVNWAWRANGGTTSSGSGDLTSTHQVDPSGGFSIVKAVGDGSGSGDKTVTHGMSAPPDCILAKNLDSTFNWDTYWSRGLSSGYSLRLNTNDNQLSGRWGTVNSSIFTCKYNYTWVGTDNFIYYCFRNIEGFIRVSTYKGNSDNNGSAVYCGFRPAWILLREVASDNWGIYDNKRIGQNNDDGEGNAVLYADENYDEENQASRAIDLTAFGFKLRTSNATFNANGTYVYLAMAHNPFQYSTSR